jgi:hypothetical protein
VTKANALAWESLTQDLTEENKVRGRQPHSTPNRPDPRRGAPRPLGKRERQAMDKQFHRSRGMNRISLASRTTVAKSFSIRVTG